MARLFSYLVPRLILLSFLAVIACAGPAQAYLTWCYVNATLADGGSVTGSFAVNPMTDQLQSPNITVMANPLTIASLTPAVSNPITFSGFVSGIGYTSSGIPNFQYRLLSLL
jgi:hypothetical protein